MPSDRLSKASDMEVSACLGNFEVTLRRSYFLVFFIKSEMCTTITTYVFHSGTLCDIYSLFESFFLKSMESGQDTDRP